MTGTCEMDVQGTDAGTTPLAASCKQSIFFYDAMQTAVIELQN